jgi:16S rRNA (cytosine967-C5)-methyltransferase
VISPARDVALDILLKAEQGGFASDLLHSERLDKLSTQDRALATELVMGVLRWRSRLDEAIANLSSQRLDKLDAEVLESLRLAAYQIGFLARIPAHAAVNDSVELVKRKKKRSAAPFVNAVLRKLLAKPELLGPLLAPGPKTIPELSALYAHPLWLVDRWAQQFGLERTERICAYDQQAPSTAIHLSHPRIEAELVEAGIELAPGRLLRSTRIVVNGDVTKSPAFREGRIHIQDEGSQLVALLAGRGERLLDCCAAPGGKTAILAERNPRSEIVATELHEHRAQALARRLHGRSNIKVFTADVTQFSSAGDFDRVLADVPCSGTGTLARNPEIKWRLQTQVAQHANADHASAHHHDDLADLHSRQVGIVRAALANLRSDGRVLYSTCSLEPEENEAVVAESRATVLPVAPELEALQREGELLIDDPSRLTDGRVFRLLPGQFGTDGFFAALLAR